MISSGGLIMKMLKKIISSIIVVCMIFTAAPLNELIGFQFPVFNWLKALAEEENDSNIVTGECGENVFCSFDMNTGSLVISGEGEIFDCNLDEGGMYFFYNDSIPKDKITSVTIENGVTKIGDNAFYWCENLRDVIISDSVVTIGNYAFGFCFNLYNITVSNSVTSIGDGAFNTCSCLSSITIPDSVTYIGNKAFAGCGVDSMRIPNGVTYIGQSAFQGCCNLESIIIPDSVTSIEIYTFDGCTSLASITIPDSVTSIGNRAF